MLKLTIKKSELPAVSTDGKYYFRLRVVTSNGDKASYWTPLLSVKLPDIGGGTKMVYTPLTASAYTTKLGGGRYSIILSWDDPNDFATYDIYARWHDETGKDLGWKYLAPCTTRTYEYVTDALSDPNVTIQLAIVRPTYQKFSGTDDLTNLALLVTRPIQISTI